MVSEPLTKDKPKSATKPTVAALAKVKCLPIAHLHHLGLRDVPNGVAIPYYDAAGNDLFERTRQTLTGKNVTMQPPGVRLAAYGSERIDRANKAAVLFVFEGESDCWTLWHHGLPALGIPGAGAAKVIEAEHVEAVTEIYIGVEPDQGGKTFRAGVLARLLTLGFVGKVYELRMPAGVKDPSDLHIDNPKLFVARFEECVKAATKIDMPLTPGPTAADWQPPIELDELPDVPAFPVDCLPKWLEEWVTAEAEATQTPPDLAAQLALAEIGAGIARKFRVQIRDGFNEPTNIYTVTALEVGERKSAVVSDATEPVQQYEREEQERMAPLIAEAASEYRIMEARLKTAETKAAKEEDATERQRLRHEATELAKELEARVVPETLVMVCDDETPESLGRLLAFQGGRMLIASAEGTTFDIAKGRYSETANFDVYLKGHAGDELRVGRVSREREHVIRPALSIALAVQPDVIRGLAENATMRQRGFLARFAYSIPRSKVGWRTIAPNPVPASVAAQFRGNMMTLWQLPGPAQDNGYTAHYLRYSSAADDVLRELERWLEPKLAKGEELHHLAGWAQKLAGLVARLSAILHMAAAIGLGANWNTPILPETVQAAVTIGRDYLLPHAKAAFGLMGANPKVSTAQDVWSAIVRRIESSEINEREPTISLRDIHQWNRRSFPSADDVPVIAKVLCDFGYLREQEGSGRPGRGSKSPLYLVNPLALATAHKDMEARTHRTHCTHSDDEEWVGEVSESSECSEYATATLAETTEEGKF